MRSPRLLPLMALLAACGGNDRSPTARSHPDAEVDPEWIVVDFVDGTTQAEVDAWERDWGVDLSLNSPHAEDEALTLGRVGADAGTVLARIRRHPAVEAAEPLYLYRALWEPDDPQYPLQWHLQTVGAPQAWDHSRGDGVVVAVVDTGIAWRDGDGRRGVEDLAGASVREGWDFVHDRPGGLDDHGHGTHVAGTIAQVTGNGVGVAGLAPEATLLPVKVLSRSGAGSSVDIADGIHYAVEQGARIINLSLGGGGASPVIALAVARARRAGVLVVAAAGNTGRGRVAYPAAFPGVIGVSATRLDDALAPYSSWGPQVDLAAPGGDKTVDLNHDGHPDGVLQNTLDRAGDRVDLYDWYQGTSMATPHVSGAAALVMATGVTDPGAVEAALFDTARKVQGRTRRDERFGHGVVDAGAAVVHTRSGLSLWRLVWAVLAAVVLILRPGRGLPGGGIARFLVTLLVTAVGLFFLPWLLPRFPGLDVLSRPLMDWGLPVFGAGAHANLLTWSALLPFGLALLTFQHRRARPWLAGLSAGAAAFLLHAATSGHADVIWLPGRLLDGLWLMVNAALAFLLAWALLRRRDA